MAVTVSLYNHTIRRFADGSNAAGDVYKLMLCTAATFNAADTTLDGITKTETTPEYGYIAGGATLSNVVVNTVQTNAAAFNTDDVTWVASGDSITASFAILYNDTDTGKPPLLFIDFGGPETAAAGATFLVSWPEGVFEWSPLEL